MTKISTVFLQKKTIYINQINEEKSMKFKFKSTLIAATTLLCGLSLQSSAAPTCPTCSGYWYTAFTQLNNSGSLSYQYAYRGAYSSHEECQQAVNADQGNNDSWLPYYGSPICTYRNENDIGAYDDILDFWNLSNEPSHPGFDLMNHEELIRNIVILREEYDVDAYERHLDSMITDPEM